MTKLLKLPKKEKTRWLEALRSGKYKQVQKRLKGKNGFCCLGVLHDCRGGKWDEYEAVPRKGSMPGELYNIGPLVPKTVSKVLTQPTTENGVGLDLDATKKVWANGEYNTSDIESTLMWFNDKKKWSFKQIANWIEKNL